MIFLGSEVKNNTAVPYLVAEISGNHGGKLDTALRLVEEAKRSGANAVKVQCYDADALTLPTQFEIQGTSLWKGKNLYELYMQAATPYDWMGPLFEHANKVGIPIYSSVYDERGIQELTRVGCRAFKIASYEANDIPFIEKVKATGKPLVVSTGTLNNIEIERLVAAVDENNTILLHCVSNYPCDVPMLGLKSMRNLMSDYFCPVGLSCHTDDPLAPILAAQQGAAMIELHFTLEEDEAGFRSLDYEFSLTPNQMTYTVGRLKEVAQSNMESWPSEEEGTKYKRSLYVIRDIRRGEVFSKANVGSFRPNLGCDPALLPQILGKKANQSLTRNTPMKMEYVR